MKKKIIVVGGGRWGTNHIKTLIGLDSFYAVVEPNQGNQSKLKKQFPNIKIYNNLEDSYSSNPDGYTVVTPPETHFDISVDIINNRKPLLVEKPLTLDYDSSKKIVDLANKNNINLLVGHVLLFHPAIQKIKELIDSDYLGDLKYLYSNRLNLGIIRNNEDVFWSLASHDISVFQYLVDSDPININSFSQSFLQNNINDMTMASFKYENDIKAHIFTSWVNPFKEHKLVIIGTKGMLVFEDSSINKNIFFYDGYYEMDKNNSIKAIHKEREIINFERSMPLTNELDYFIDNLDSKFTISNGELGLKVVKILERI